MGAFKPFSSCRDDEHNHNQSHTQYVYVDQTPGNPNPTRFNINRMHQVGRFLIAEVYYPDCQNYEGTKILIFEGLTKADLQKLTSLDPHFCNSAKHLSPIARFVPTKEGWRYASLFCQHA